MPPEEVDGAASSDRQRVPRISKDCPTGLGRVIDDSIEELKRSKIGLRLSAERAQNLLDRGMD
jgi:hypothetical protein